MEDVRYFEYGKSGRVTFSLYDYATGKDLVVPTFAAGDARISIDEGAPTATGVATPVSVGEGLCYIDLTAAQLTGKRIMLRIVDLTASKVWLDRVIYLETFGHHLAQDPGDILHAGQAQAVALNQITLAANAVLANGHMQDAVVEITSSTTAPESVGQQRFIASTDAATDIATLERDFQILPTGVVTYVVRKSAAGGNTVDVGSFLGDQPAVQDLINNIGNLDALVSSRSSHTAANVRTEIDNSSTKLADLVAGTYGSFDGYNMAQTMKLLLSIAVGRLSGADLATLNFKAANNPATTRVVITTDATGRTGVTITV